MFMYSPMSIIKYMVNKYVPSYGIHYTMLNFVIYIIQKNLKMPPKKVKPLTGKQRQQQWRNRKKTDSETHELYLQAERERYARRKAVGKRKVIADLMPREQRKQRKTWKRQQLAHREKLKTAEQHLTPPVSPELVAAEPQPSGGSGGNKIRGRKHVRRDRAKAYRTIKTLTVKLQHAQLATRRVQKRYERVQKKLKSVDAGTPKSKSRKIMESGHKGRVHKCLTFSLSLVSSIRERYRQLKTQQEKKLVRKLFSSSYLKKYRLLKHAERSLGISRNIIETGTSYRKRRRDRHADATIQTIRDFFLRDDNSSMTPGKKDSISKSKQKMQKRLLGDSLLNLHRKFVYEQPTMRVSYPFFCRQKPFWVVRPTAADRETCKCRTHENMQLMADRLYNLKVIKEKYPENILHTVCCSVKSSECMYRECNDCKDRRVKFEPYERTETTWWYEWKLVDHEYKNKSGKTETTKKTAKIRVEGTVDRLADLFDENLCRKLCRHVFNIRHQYKELLQKKLSLGNHEMMMHIDFSENYALKYHTEIQSVHFGASNDQATLHTGMLYAKRDSFGFASISACRRHDASAIWAHLKPVFDYVAHNYPDIDTVYFVSDGPTTQYRCKNNFYLLSTKPFEWGMKLVNWSFLEAGHGKGAADGIGGVLKRTADRLVAEGNDIADAQSLFDALLKNTNVRLFYVTEEDVSLVDTYVDKVMLRSIPGTMAFHQLVSCENGKVSCRRLSCFCNNGRLCACFKPFSYKFPDRSQSLAGVHTSSNSAPVVQPCDTAAATAPRNDPEPATNGNVAEETHSTPDPDETNAMQPVYIFEEGLIGKYCIVKYDKIAFPSVIEDADEESVRVNCMHRVGPNRFFWPSRKDDDIWYEYTSIVTLIPPPKHVTDRHFEVEPAVWAEVAKVMDDWVRQ